MRDANADYLSTSLARGAPCARAVIISREELTKKTEGETALLSAK
jgi:hypothetical protein